MDMVAKQDYFPVLLSLRLTLVIILVFLENLMKSKECLHPWIKVMHEPWLRGKGEGWICAPQGQDVYNITVNNFMMTNVIQQDTQKIRQLFTHDAVRQILKVSLLKNVHKNCLAWIEEQNGNYNHNRLQLVDECTN